MIRVRSGDRVVECPAGTRLSELLPGGAVAARVNGELADLSSSLEHDSVVEPVEFGSEEGRSIFWHSAAHLLAQAVKSLYPDAKLGIGPAIEEGFYYDFDLEHRFSEEDLSRIEAEMRVLAQQDMPIVRRLIPKEELTDHFRARGEDYKLELLSELPDGLCSVYEQGDFLDLCLGPHLPRTGLIQGVKLLSVAGAYWRGDERRGMLQRIYGVAFPTQEELDHHLELLEMARARDHRELGPKLGLFDFYEEAGPGLVFWHPKGVILRRTIEEYWVSEHLKRGYLVVSTPHIARAQLWHTSGHYDYYREHMYLLPVEKEEYVLKPMNCPGHILIYRSAIRSYRDLPMRLAELGTVYRNERSGVLHGLLRVRGFTIDDAHIFCTPEQVEEEVKGALEFGIEVLADFGFREYRVELSLSDPNHPESYMGSNEDWELSEGILKRILKGLGVRYQTRLGEAVFYGPKIDIQLLDALGRSWQTTTIQFDFFVPRRFELCYIGSDGGRHPVYMVHRALFGSMERFIGALIEHYGGALPVWLSPYQAAVLNLTHQELEYARRVVERLIAAGIRTVARFESQSLGYKIGAAEREKIPYILVVGKRERERGTVAVRERGIGDRGEVELERLVSEIVHQIQRGGRGS